MPTSRDYFTYCQVVILTQLDRLNPNRSEMARQMKTHRGTLNRWISKPDAMPTGQFFRLLELLEIDPYTLKTI